MDCMCCRMIGPGRIDTCPTCGSRVDGFGQLCSKCFEKVLNLTALEVVYAGGLIDYLDFNSAKKRK